MQPAAMAAMVARAKETLDSYDYALAYNYLERRVVEISGTLSEEQLAAKAALVGAVHAPGLAQRIATGRAPRPPPTKLTMTRRRKGTSGRTARSTLWRSRRTW